MRRRIVRKVQARRVSNGAGTRRAELQAEIGHLVDAIASGFLRTSPALAGRLARAEGELAGLQQAPAPMDAGNVVTLLPRVMTTFRALVAEINRAHVAGALLSAAGSPLQMVMVAGDRFGTFRRELDIV